MTSAPFMIWVKYIVRVLQVAREFVAFAAINPQLYHLIMLMDSDQGLSLQKDRGFNSKRLSIVLRGMRKPGADIRSAN
jgi:hypothetical protein